MESQGGTTTSDASVLRLLTEAARSIHSGLPTGELLQQVVELARVVVGAHQSVISLTLDESWAQSISAISLSDKYAAWRDYEEAPDGSGIYSLVARDGTPLRLTQDELEAHPAYRHFGGAAGVHPPLRGLLAVPMVASDGSGLGLLQLSDKYEGDFTEEDEELALHLAQLAALAIENARLVDEAREAEALIKTMQAAAPVGFALFDEDLRYMRVNAALAEMNGRPAEDHIGKTPSELLGDELAANVEPRLREVLETRTPAANLEVSGAVPAVDGGERHWLVSHYPVEAAGVRGVGSIVVDVTDRRSDLERLSRSEARYRHLVETTQDLVWTVDAEGRFEFLNGAVERIYGYAAEEMLGQPFIEFVPPERRDQDLVRFGQAAGGAPLEGVTELLRKDGSHRLVEFRALPVTDADGNVVGITGTSTDITERANSERALRESERRFRSVFENAVVGMVLAESNGRLIQANPAFCRLIGRTEKELHELTLQDIVHPHDHDIIRARRDRQLAGEPDPGPVEMRYLRDDGQPVWTRAMGAAVRDSEGKLVYTILQAVDLTEQRRLEQTTNRLYALTRDLFCTVGFDGAFRSLNPAWEHALGYSSEELTSTPFMELVHPDDRPRTTREFERLLASGDLTLDFENRFRHKDGSYRWLLWSVYVTVEERQVYCVGKEVTDRKRSEERLRDSERKYRDLVETSSDLIWSVDVGGCFTFVNRAVRRIYGYEPEEMLGRPIADFESDEQRLKDEEAFKSVLRGTPLFNYETRHVRKDGGPVDLSVNAIVLHDESGAVLGATGTATDVSDRKRSEMRQAAVAELGRRALEGVGVAEVTEAAVSLVAETLGVEYAHVLELTTGGDQLKLYAEVGWPPGSAGRLMPAEPESSQAAYAIQLDGPVIVEDFRDEQRFERPPALAELRARSGVCVTVEGESRPFGVLCAHSTRRRAFTADEVNFLQAVANVLATAIGRKQTEQRIVELASARGRLVAQTLAAEDRARRSISEVLHDHALQDLLASRQDLVEVIEDPEGDAERVVRAREGIERAVQLLREAVFNLHPVVLEHAGLASAIRAVADHQARRGGFDCEIEVDPGATGVHDELILSLARELLTNAAKHSGAQNVRVGVQREDEWILLSVEDDGSGIEPGRREAALREGHVGLASSTERVEALSGRFQVEGRAGGGTSARAVLPARRAAPHRADLPGRLARLSGRQRGDDL
jgi:PAS domain S-box-containing protein